MKKMHEPGLAGLLVALALTLAACGGAGGSAGGNHDGSRDEEHAPRSDNAARGGTAQEEAASGMAGMDHGQMGGEGMARRMLEDQNGEYSDRRFIDMMVSHHRGAVEMAEVALENHERREILDLSKNIVRTQQAEIEELEDIKREEFGTNRVSTEMDDDQMRGMGMMMDPRALADERPFDKAFIDAMIPHHQSAIDMANVALAGSENPRVRTLAENIASTQKREIAEMKKWRNEWYPEG